MNNNNVPQDFEQDCPGYNVLPTILPATERIIVIGDLHGDIEVTKQCLMLANVIDENWRWKTNDKYRGKTVVVQIGDQVDRCRPRFEANELGQIVPLKCDNPRTTIKDEASDIIIMKLFTYLHYQAVPYGGAVYSLLGNHELMNVEKNMSYVSLEGIIDFDTVANQNDDVNNPMNPLNISMLDFLKGKPSLEESRKKNKWIDLNQLARTNLDQNSETCKQEEKEEYNEGNNLKYRLKRGREKRIEAFKPGGKYSTFMGCTRQSALVIGSNIFVHAGVLPSFLETFNITKKEDLDVLNYSIRKFLLDKPGLPKPTQNLTEIQRKVFGKYLADKITKNYVADIVNSKRKNSMFWTRVLGNIPPNSNIEDGCTELERSLQILQMGDHGKMIVGHTPQFIKNKEGINGTCNGKLWRVDVGSSKAFSPFDSKSVPNVMVPNTSDQINTDQMMKARGIQILEILNDNQFNIIASN